jgi:hypothetical protein
MKARLFPAALVVLAQDQPQATPAEPGMGGPRGGTIGGMMEMMNMMGQADPQQMNRMVENCNRMMESQLQPSNSQPWQPEGRPEPKG